MPTYEYRCGACRRRSSVLFRTFAAAAETPSCPLCGAPPEQLQKLVSRVAVLKSEESRMESLADPSMFGDVDENDPRSVAKWARKLGEQLGDDAPDDYGELVDQIESGDMPEDMGGMDSGEGSADFGGGPGDF